MNDEHHHTDSVKGDQLEELETDDLYEAILLLKTPEEIQRFLKDLCTPQELNAFNERWKVCKLLQHGTMSYRQISELTSTSLATIVRVARCLKDEPAQGYRIVLDRMPAQKKK